MSAAGGPIEFLFHVDTALRDVDAIADILSFDLTTCLEYAR